jgi:glycosyltransferase involved in cell wall biosynthesis
MERANQAEPRAKDQPRALVLSYWNLNAAAFGGGRRIEALLQVLNDRTLLCQPAPPHPRYETIPYRLDLGRRKRGINWGMFNFFWPGQAALVRRLINDHQPAVVVHTSMWTFFPLRHRSDLPQILDAHDVNAVAVGERCGAKHPFTRLVRAWEARVTRRVDHVFACSPGDREQFMAHYGLSAERVSVAPNGVDTAELKSAAPIGAEWEPRLGGCRVLFFMGKLDYQPNRLALAFLNDECMPRLERLQPGRFKLLVCGGPVPSGTFHPAILFAGRVPAIPPYLHRADICLAPIFTGSGTRLKILEYLAAGKPVVATPKAAEGLGSESGRDLLVADPATFADAVARLAGQAAEAQRLGENGRAFVRAHYDWSVSRREWSRILGRWLVFPPDSAPSRTDPQ